MAEIDLNALLKAETYQGMTDEEIDAIVDYKVERAKIHATVSKDMETHRAIMKELMDAQSKSSAEVLDSFKTVIDTPAIYKEVNA